MIAPTTPTGSLTTRLLPISSSNGNESSNVANVCMFPAGSPAWIMVDQVIGMPTSPAMVEAMSADEQAAYWLGLSDVGLRAPASLLVTVAVVLGDAVAQMLGSRPR